MMSSPAFHFSMSREEDARRVCDGWYRRNNDANGVVFLVVSFSRDETGCNLVILNGVLPCHWRKSCMAAKPRCRQRAQLRGPRKPILCAYLLPPISCRPFQTARRLKKKRCLSPRVRASRDPGGPVLGIADHLLYRWRVQYDRRHPIR